MSPNAPAGPDDFREQLSAWHDGALPDEASRFVLRRLLQDDVMRAEVGRWQVIGDVLRRQSQQGTTPGLATRITAALAEVDRLDVPSLQERPRGQPLRWLATAAGLVLAAVLLWPVAPPTGEGDKAVASVSTLSTPRQAEIRTMAMVPRLPASEPASVMASVPPLVRAPQPTPEQLAPLPAVDVQGRPWPRTAAGDGPYTVEYRVPADVPSRQ